MIPDSPSIPPVRIIKTKPLAAFWAAHPDAEPGLRQWIAECRAASWRSMADVKAYAHSADWVGNHRVVFNVAGSKYRLVVAVHFGAGIVLVKFVGTHAEYDRIDVRTVEIKET